MKRITALQKFLGEIKKSQIKQGYNEHTFETEDGEYMVLTDSEADEMAADYIKDSLWAFNPSFLSDETGIDYEVFKAIQDNGKCEDNNSAIESCIDDIDSFIEAAISADGRGHFINSYDGEEKQQGEYYIYRTN